MADQTIRVSSYTGGIVGPHLEMLGPVADGGTIVAETAPGCWGPIITPHFRGGHEVTQPVAVAGAEVGDAIAIRIQSVRIRSRASASGTSRMIEGRRFTGGPLVTTRCPGCGAENPRTVLTGVGAEAIRCARCGAAAIPAEMINGYTMVFDAERSLGLTVGPRAAAEIAHRAAEYAALPPDSTQHSVLTLARADLTGILARVRPLVGNLGTTPAVQVGDSANRGAWARFGQDDGDGDPLTDAHMDIDSVREGAIVLCPVRVPGGGVYVGDVHAMQGQGEIANHTTDVSAEVTLRVEVVKGLALEGPIVLPPVEDLPPLARPWTESEREAGRRLAAEWGVAREETAPIQVVGSGQSVDAAIGCALERAARLLGMSLDEVRNRATITGSVEIGHTGMAKVTLLAPLPILDRLGIGRFAAEQYGAHPERGAG